MLLPRPEIRITIGTGWAAGVDSRDELIRV
jgi:hypothetical protein